MRTPGPWRVGDAGRTVFGPPNGQPSPETVANVHRKANARAIAALPQLIEAARKAVNRLEAWYDTAKALSRRLPDSDAATWTNLAENYSNIVNPLRFALRAAGEEV